MGLLAPCLGYGRERCGIPAPKGGCDTHRRMRERAHHNRAYDDPAWRTFRDAILKAWRALHGNWCPGVRGERHAPHFTADLTVDHPMRLVDGGELTPADARVMCRSLNSSLGARRGR